MAFELFGCKTALKTDVSDAGLEFLPGRAGWRIVDFTLKSLQKPISASILNF